MIQALKKIHDHRIVVYYLIKQEIKTAHRDKILGNIWMLLDPLAMMLVLYMVFSEIRQASVIFCLYLFTGLLPWDIFAKSQIACTTCLRNRKNIIHKIPLPLAIFPISIVLHKVFDFAWGMAAYALIFIAVSLISDQVLGFSWLQLLIPLWLVMFILLTMGVGMVISYLGCFFQDMRDIVNVLLRLGFFVNPVFISMSYIPEAYHVPYFMVNPIAGYLIYLRMIMPGGDVILDHYQIPIPYYPVYLVVVTFVIFVAGFALFQSGQKRYAKYI